MYMLLSAKYQSNQSASLCYVHAPTCGQEMKVQNKNVDVNVNHFE